MNEQTPQPPDILSEGDVNISPRCKAWLAEHVGAETARLLERDARVFFHQALSTPCVNALAACEGAEIMDTQGRRFLDFHGNSVHQVGFRNPAVIEAVKAQLDTLPFCPRRYTNAPAVSLAEKLAALAPGGPNKVLLAPGGTTAVGMALKLARAATGRFKTVSMWDSFHGASLDAISVGGETIFRRGAGPLLPGAEHVPPPEPYRCVWGCRDNCTLRCADYVEYVLEKEGDVAAVIAETVRSTAVVPPPDGYWKKIRDACDRHGALLILDETAVCLGRTGAMFAAERYRVRPDILICGKGLGGGVFPLAAVIASAELDVCGQGAIGHYTHEKSPVGAAAALATIEFIEAEDLINKAEQMGRHALGRLAALKDKHPVIGDVRGVGLLLGVELVEDRGSRRPARDAAEAVMYAALARGLSFKVSQGNILTLVPPLTVTREQMDRAIDILDDCLP